MWCEIYVECSSRAQNLEKIRTKGAEYARESGPTFDQVAFLRRLEMPR